MRLGYRNEFGSAGMSLFDKTRRRFIQLGLSTLACTVAMPALASFPRIKGDKSLAFHNLHTDERLSIVYWQNGEYVPNAHARINHILRDHYSGDVYPIDMHLIDLLYDLQTRLHNDRPIEVISGYRSPRTNLELASISTGVAKNSYHTKGMAIDIRMSGVPLPVLHNTALEMRRGGVGYYPDSQFVHVDVGPRRFW